MHAVRNGQLLTFRCPGTSSPAVCWIRFSIASLQCRLHSFCYITNDMKSRSQWQCSVKLDGTTRAHPDNRKMKVKTFFLRFARRATITTHLYTLPSAVAVPLQNTSHRRCYWFINILGVWYTCIKFKTKRQESYGTAKKTWEMQLKCVPEFLGETGGNVSWDVGLAWVNVSLNI